MVIPTPDSGILKRLYANLLGSGGAISLDIPDKVLRRLYTYGSPKNTDERIAFEVKNRLQDAEFAGVGPRRSTATGSTPRDPPGYRRQEGSGTSEVPGNLRFLGFGERGAFASISRELCSLGVCANEVSTGSGELALLAD